MAGFVGLEHFDRNGDLAKVRGFAIVLLLYTAATLAMTFPAILHFNTHFIGDGSDGLTNVWNMWWMKKALTELFTSPYYTTWLHHPHGHTLLLHSLNPFNSIISIPLQYLFSIIVVYNLIVLFAFAMSGVTMYYLAHYLTRDTSSAFIAGLAFTFCPYHMAHGLGHLNLISVEWMPLFVLFLLRLIDRGNIRDGALAGITLTLTAMCSWYSLLFSAVLSVAIVLGRWRTVLNDKKKIWGLGVCIAVPLVLLGPLIGSMIYVRSTETFSPGHIAGKYSADLTSFFVPNGISSMSQLTKSIWGKYPGNISEDANYLGYGVMVLSVIGIVKVRAARFWGVASLLFLSLSMGSYLRILGEQYQVPLPYKLLHDFTPLFSFTGVPERFGVLVALCLAITAAFGIRELMAGLKSRRKGPLAAFLAGLVILLEFSAVPYPASHIPIPPIYYEIAKEKDEFAIMDLPIRQYVRSRYLYFATIHNKPIIGGYVSRTAMKNLDFFELNPLLGSLRNPVRSYRLPLPESLPLYSRLVFSHFKIKYLIVHENADTSFIEDTLKLPLVDDRGGIKVFDCYSPIPKKRTTGLAL